MYGDKSYVTIEQHVCLVCGKTFDSGALLLDQRLRPRFERHTTTGWGLCPEHKQRYDEGYIALVEADPTKSENKNGTILPEKAYRTGRVVHMHRDAVAQLFNIPIVDSNDKLHPILFVEPAVVDHLLSLQRRGTQ